MSSDSAYDVPRLAALYDLQNPWAACDDYYLERMLAAPSVLDVGCGTGTLLVAARARGHAGDLVGVDPARAMLDIAAAKDDTVDWHRAAAERLDLGRRFDLVTMTGHAFQCLRDDDTIVAALRAFRRHLAVDGRLVFETRDPAARAWEDWAAFPPTSYDLPDGSSIRVHYEVPGPRGEDLVDFAEIVDWGDGEVTRSDETLRFASATTLARLIAEAGLAVDHVHGAWDGRPVGADTSELIVTARAV